VIFIAEVLRKNCLGSQYRIGWRSWSSFTLLRSFFSVVRWI